MAMAVAMAAMMAPTAAPFFVAFAQDDRRAVPIAAVVLVYVAVWALIGVVACALMNVVMIPSSQPVVVAAAVVFAALYSVMPWSLWARNRCREMCRETAHRGALAAGVRYAACCVVCSAGVMAALVVIGMSNVLVMAAAAGAMLVYKVA